MSNLILLREVGSELAGHDVGRVPSSSVRSKNRDWTFPNKIRNLKVVVAQVQVVLCLIFKSRERFPRCTRERISDSCCNCLV